MNKSSKIKNLVQRTISLWLKKSKFQEGFTLIELLVVIVIIGVLASLLMSNFIGIRQRARDSQRKSDLRQVQAALEMYRADNGNYPDDLDFASCGVSAFKNEAETVTYMQKIPCDPLNSDQYVYTYSSDGSTYSLFSCLENVNDSQKDTANNGSYCAGGTTNWSFTLQNP